MSPASPSSTRPPRQARPASPPAVPSCGVGAWSAPVAEVLLVDLLPGLPAGDLATTAGFVARRIDGLPAPLRLGVAVVTLLYRALLALPGGPRLVRVLARRPLPLVGEYPRLVRSLALAFVFETWPDRRADGSPAT